MDLTDIQTIKSLLMRYNLRPNKYLGQHFLIDEKVLQEIIGAAEISKKDMVLEIGPGLGVLTLELAKRAKKVIAVEKDEKLCEVLQNILETQKIKNVEIINDDILKLIGNWKLPASLSRLVFDESKRARKRGEEIGNYKIVANLPYYLTARVIRKLLELPNPPTEMILMIQKEVGKRICARPPKMNLLAAAVQFYGTPEIVAWVSKESFWPAPEVNSAILKIKTSPGKSSPIDREKFFKIVRAGFTSPRKKLANNLIKAFGIENRRKIEKILIKTGVRADCRGQDLSVDNWRKLASLLKKYIV